MPGFSRSHVRLRLSAGAAFRRVLRWRATLVRPRLEVASQRRNWSLTTATQPAVVSALGDRARLLRIERGTFTTRCTRLVAVSTAVIVGTVLGGGTIRIAAALK